MLIGSWQIKVKLSSPINFLLLHLSKITRLINLINAHSIVFFILTENFSLLQIWEFKYMRFELGSSKRGSVNCQNWVFEWVLGTCEISFFVKILGLRGSGVIHRGHVSLLITVTRQILYTFLLKLKKTFHGKIKSFFSYHLLSKVTFS